MSDAMRARMTTPRPESDLLKKEAKRLRDGNKETRKTRKSQIQNMSGPTLTRELKRLSIPDHSKGEAGIKRVQLLDAFGLGLPTVKSWTKRSIVYMLEEIFEHTDYDHNNVKTKDAAIRFLQEFIAKKCLGPPPPAPNTTEANTAV